MVMRCFPVFILLLFLSLSGHAQVSEFAFKTTLTIDIGPNPSYGAVRVSLQNPSYLGSSYVEVLTPKGKLLEQIFIKSMTTELDLRHFADGAYLIRIVTLEGQMSKRIMIL
jgi:hypothetical protein